MYVYVCKYVYFIVCCFRDISLRNVLLFLGFKMTPSIPYDTFL